jgi:D-alanine-D-alanine ligase
LEQLGSDVPLSRGPLLVGIIYNLKKGLLNSIPDAEAEYDSIETVVAIKSALEVKGHQVLLLEADEALPKKLCRTPIHIAFNIAEGLQGRGREAQIPAMLGFFGIPFTGSDETTLCVTLDKALTKRLLLSYGFRTPAYQLFAAEGLPVEASLNYPVIVKPNAEGSSKGISDKSIVTSPQALHKLVRDNLRLYGGAMLAEEYIAGREFTVGLLGNGVQTRVFSPMEIIFKKGVQENYHVYSYPVKQNYREFIDYQCPAQLDQKQENKMMAMARDIYHILGCRDFARIDFRLSGTGEIYFLEINPLPGLAPDYSDYPMLAGFCGLDYTGLINGILQAAIERYNKRLG